MYNALRVIMECSSARSVQGQPCCCHLKILLFRSLVVRPALSVSFTCPCLINLIVISRFSCSVKNCNYVSGDKPGYIYHKSMIYIISFWKHVKDEVWGLEHMSKRPSINSFEREMEAASNRHLPLYNIYDVNKYFSVWQIGKSIGSFS